MSDLPVTVTDGVVILVLGLSALMAFARGFLQEVMSVGAWLGAALTVLFGLPLARPAARALIQPPLLADVVAGGIIFVVALIILSIVTGQIGQRVKTSSLSAIDRSLGVAFGLARGALIVCLTYIAIAWLVPAAEQPAWLREARTRPLIEAGAEWLKSVVRSHSDVGSTADRAQDEIRKALETERLVRDMMSPEPKTPESPGMAANRGYSERERRELERLLDSDR